MLMVPLENEGGDLRSGAATTSGEHGASCEEDRMGRKDNMASEGEAKSERNQSLGPCWEC